MKQFTLNEDKSNNENSWPVSILPNLTKAYLK